MEPMNYIIFTIAAFIMGFLAAIPIGPIQIEVARRAINGHLKSSFMVAFGSFTVDVLYGVIAFFGIAPFLLTETVRAVFWLIGGIFLLVLSYIIIISSSKLNQINLDATHLMKKRWGFVSGLALSIVNPMTILWWLMGQRLFMDMGLIHNFTMTIAVSFIIVVRLGLASYHMLLSLFIYWTKKFIPASRMKLINRSFGLALLLVALYFFFKSIPVLL